MGKLLAIVGALLVALFGYVIYKVWAIFGVWPMILSIVVNLGVGTIITHLIGSKTKTDDGYMFNPRELPKYLAICLSALVGYYLYSKIGSPDLSAYNRNFGLVWIVLVVALPIAFEAYKLARDRNDFVKIAGHQLSYRDNDDHGEISLQQVKQVELVAGNVKLTLLDGQDRMINTSQMNFRGRDLVELVAAIKECLPATINPDEVAQEIINSR